MLGYLEERDASIYAGLIYTVHKGSSTLECVNMIISVCVRAHLEGKLPLAGRRRLDVADAAQVNTAHLPPRRCIPGQ